jgi:hypothetical protein
MRQGPCGCPLDRIAKAGGSTFGNHYALCSRCERGSYNCTKIMWIFDAIQQDDQALRGFRSEQIIKFRSRFCRCERGDTLMLTCASESVDLLPVLKTERHSSRFRKSHNSLDALAMPPSRDYDSVKWATCC